MPPASVSPSVNDPSDVPALRGWKEGSVRRVPLPQLQHRWGWHPPLRQGFQPELHEWGRGGWSHRSGVQIFPAARLEDQTDMGHPGRPGQWQVPGLVLCTSSSCSSWTAHQPSPGLRPPARPPRTHAGPCRSDEVSPLVHGALVTPVALMKSAPSFGFEVSGTWFLSPSAASPLSDPYSCSSQTSYCPGLRPLPVLSGA